ncbi:PEP-CTERM motif protein [Rubripirellula obstinata]|uniref:PEP-CTERM motif protein n=1 Tax=Rubripirellula obstinata TaxID=406547 RepID=A0A5B1CJG5_9BACT|nr:PEP-CTERM sorting domain-containing protein [Rubripirellula obstinata]KAA1261317.1 PEP-CTERM motif protein [Rubripirellula obstinata]
MKKIMFALLAAAVGLNAQLATAAVVADGSLGGAEGYGSVLFTQDTPTGFGDNTDATVGRASGSEINGVYGVVSGGNLNVLVTGNVETNFNRLVLYIDSVAGGQTTLDDTNGLGSPFNDYNGTVLDAGFGADYGLILNGGNDPAEYFLDFATIGSSTSFLGGSLPGSTTLAGSNGINVGIDQSNILGVTDTLVSGAGAVTTGLEFSIPLGVIGSPTGDIRLAGFIAGGGFVSNQVIGGVGGAGNVEFAPNFSTIAGNQFVTIAIPEPTSFALLAIGGGFVAARRRRK